MNQMKTTLKRNFSWHALPLTLLDDFGADVFLKVFAESM
jgi:hypothetical protein